MSKNSTARFSADGDADSNTGEIYPNARSRSSSYKGRKDIEGGPYGDSPSDRNEQAYKEYLFYMIQENEESPGTSDCSVKDQELYNLRNDYLEKLNFVRRRLNLIEIKEDAENNSARSSYRPGCTITELTDEEHQEKVRSRDRSNDSKKKVDNSKTNSERSENLEIKTIHPFSVGYSMTTESISNLLELEYNPPKKKSCFRLRTPKLPSASESNIPYHTKVSLHEDLFKKNPEPESTENVKTLSQKYYEKFTVTKETQCSDHEAEQVEHEVPVKTNLEQKSNLFPTVIVRSGSSNSTSVEGSMRDSCEPEQEPSHTRAKEAYPLNYIEESSVESYNSVTTSTTTVECSHATKYRRRRLGIKFKQGERTSVWHNLSKMNTGQGGEGEKIPSDKASNIYKKQASQDVTQFLTYRREKRRPKSSPIKREFPVPFGPIVISDYERGQNLDNRFYLFNSTSLSDEDRFIGAVYSATPDSDSGNKNTFWAGLFSCFRPIFDFIARR